MEHIDHGQFVICSPEELRPHPAYLRHHIRVSARALFEVARQGELAFRTPLIVTSERTVLDGYARLELARQQGRPLLACIEYTLTEPQALELLIRKHRRSNSLTPCIRVLLALDLEPLFIEKARLNQRTGGQEKGSSKLTEAEKMDVRSALAAVAGVCTANVSKVKQVLSAGHPEVVQAVKEAEISIHRAWLWSKQSHEYQREALGLYRSRKGIKKAIRTLVSQHRPAAVPKIAHGREPTAALDAGKVLSSLCSLAHSEPGLFSLAVMNAPGKALLITKELLQMLPSET